jgi:hypothetical protein
MPVRGRQRARFPACYRPTGFKPVPAPWRVYLPYFHAENGALGAHPRGTLGFRSQPGTPVRFILQEDAPGG